MTTIYRGLKTFAVCTLLFATLGHAKATIVTLSELVTQSQVIVYGRVVGSPAALSPQSKVRFEVSTVFKGDSLVHDGAVLLCNSRPNSEWPDVSKVAGNSVLFLAQKEGCLELSHSYRALLKVQGDQISTVTIEDQPDSQPLDQFFKKVQALVCNQSMSQP
ncbi:MAG TPA: hypothetical protein VE046_14190 [Steroidobacteraceae bacterium]|nr:hypothetical protein [Steroidobacteraceae bacterium]